MGIGGLQSFVENKLRIGSKILWDVEEAKSIDIHRLRKKLIIDGYSWLFHLYFQKLNWIYGGQYEQYACIIEENIRIFQKLGFDLIIVFDGTMNPHKKETSLKRYEERVKRIMSIMRDIATKGPTKAGTNAPMLPVLGVEVFINVIRSLDVEILVCDMEADSIVGYLANKFETFAVSQDSDFLAFDLDIGYIPIKSIKHTEEAVSALVYRAVDLANKLGFKKELLPLFASLAGNDYVSAELIHPLMQAISILLKKNVSHEPHSRIELVGYFLSQFESEAEAINTLVELNEKIGMMDKEKFFDLLSNSADQYKMHRPLLGNTSSLRTYSGNTIDQQLIETYRRGQFDHKIMNVLCNRTFWCLPHLEDSSEKTSWLVSRSLRQHIYGLILSGLYNVQIDGFLQSAAVTEYIRRGHHFTSEQVVPLAISGYDYSWTIDTLRNANRFDRSSLFLDIMHSGNELMRSLPNEYLLCASSLRFMISNMTPNVMYHWEIIAFILSLLHRPISLAKEWSTIPIRAKSIQRQCQYQCIILSASMLRHLLHLDDIPIEMRYLFNGFYFHYYYHQCEKGVAIDFLLDGNPRIVNFFNQLYAAVIDGLQQSLLCITPRLRPSKSTRTSMDEESPTKSNRNNHLPIIYN